jgi:hypothetical protein
VLSQCTACAEGISGGNSKKASGSARRNSGVAGDRWPLLHRFARFGMARVALQRAARKPNCRRQYPPSAERLGHPPHRSF